MSSGQVWALETQGLRKRFGGLLATNDVSLTVAPGEIRGLIGPNGAGKTTLVNLVTGVHAPDAGDVRLAGKSLQGLGMHQIARLGLVRSFQVTRLFGNMTVRENLLTSFLARRSLHSGDGLALTDSMIELTKLGRLADTQAKKLSGGQRALLQMACGFMVPGTCYVLDEPFSGINPVIKDSIIDMIVDVNRRHGATFLIVSHEMSIVRRLCPQVTVMMEGRVAAQGSLDEVARLPEVIAGYLGKALE
ncbi:branched-chain amino acid transport system ATP-binding protein [Enhydrobacter aerosaccus]|uniref:Branched-chain amino acid transport system ATP-binding protein n=1 Tax=Enhydrobacter aerosaccus TaxID=225324 RepID=A0A1T4TFZ9_9HYPH|nr:ATP-binding cassette domain-containing protein [Enhydrobacter aerosaccus]SKA39344.1 branched-chain amino acid transport system ATP-binding protein [Enhydrobacter aerosaccus]